MVLWFTTVHHGITMMPDSNIWQPIVLILCVFQWELEYRAKEEGYFVFVKPASWTFDLGRDMRCWGIKQRNNKLSEDLD